MGKKNKDILILTAGAIFLLAILFIPSFLPKKELLKAKVLTDKKVYQQNDILKVKIENKSKKDICFSSCYPYYFEIKNGNWERYQYERCPRENEASKCLDPEKIKAFEINIPHVGKGIHRLAIPACIGCNVSDKFRNDKWFYSNQFIIK